MHYELSGTVVDAEGGPISRPVFIIERDTGVGCGGTVSDPTTGAWGIALPAYEGEEHATRRFVAYVLDAPGDPMVGWSPLLLNAELFTRSACPTITPSATDFLVSGTVILSDETMVTGACLQFTDGYLWTAGAARNRTPWGWTTGMLEFWVKFEEVTTTQTILSEMGVYNLCSNVLALIEGKMVLQQKFYEESISEVVTENIITSTVASQAGVWEHWALCAYGECGEDLVMFRNGVPVCIEAGSSAGVGGIAVILIGKEILFDVSKGSTPQDPSACIKSNPLVGKLAALRSVSGVARPTTGFVPPTFLPSTITGTGGAAAIFDDITATRIESIV